VISAVAIAILYGPVCHFPFVYDDVSQIAENPALASWTAYWTSPVSFDTDYLPFPGQFYRPLFWWSLSLNRVVGGLDPFGYHLVNLLLHWVCGLLLFRLLTELRPAIAWPATLVWLVLPVHTEVVAWISGRPMAMAAAAVLAGLCFPRFALPAQLVALLSHEAGVVMAPLMWLIRGRVAGLHALAGLAGYAVLRLMIAPIAPSSFHPEQLWRGPLALWRTVEWTLLPWHHSMERSSDWASASAWEIVCGWLLLAVLLWASRREHLLLWVPLSLLPFFGLLPLYQGFAERYCYLASIGIVCLIAMFAVRAPRAVQAGSVAWALLLAALAMGRVQDWRDEPTLYAASLVTSPRSHVLRYNLGVLAANHADAKRWYASAVELNPRYLAAKVNLANVLQQEGDVVNAHRLYDEVLAADPRRVDALLNLANLEQRAEHFAPAEELYRRALLIDPGHAGGQFNLAALLLRTGRLPQAEQELLSLLARHPDHGQAHVNLGTLYFQSQRFAEALPHLERATQLLPDNASAWYNLGVLDESLGNARRARENYQHALALDPSHAGAAGRLAALSP
jgi:tetratricopeptide (TPR) repeat protein